MLLTNFIDDPKAIVAVQSKDGQLDEYGRISIVTEKGERWNVPRASVTTPVECCPKCLYPLEIRSDDKVYCPRFEHHMYEKFYVKSHNSTYNREQRRFFARKASYYLGLWNRYVDLDIERAKRSMEKEMMVIKKTSAMGTTEHQIGEMNANS